MSSIGRLSITSLKGDDEPENVHYGTHTLPKKFWTIKPGTNALADPAYQARRAAKRIRHQHNLDAAAAENRER